MKGIKIMKKRKVGNIENVKAIGYFVLVEMLTPDESLNSPLAVTNTKGLPPQAYIVDIGPALNRKEWGIEVGDRVVIQGVYVPVPTPTGARELGIVQAHDIKCVLVEEKA